MAHISDKDRNAFSEAYKTVLDNFTEEEQVRIGRLSAELNSILEAAKKREQEKLAKAAS
jgi:CRISPR/Cas system-associated protein Csm6